MNAPTSLTRPVQPPFPKSPAHGPLASLSRRIILAMVAVAFLSAIIGGIFYQSRVEKVISQADQLSQERILTRLDNSRLPVRVIEQVKAAIENNNGQLAIRPVVTFALDTSIWIVVLVAIGASLLAFVLGWFLTRRIIGPLEKLRNASRRVAAGDFNQRVPVGKMDEVGQVAYSFNLMAAELQGAEAKRRQLLSDVSHELKTPLASIQGHVEALRDNLPRARANPDAIYEIVLEDVEELNRMIGSLRTWLNAQSTLENLDLQPLTLADELPALAERFRPRAEAANIRLNVQLDGRVKKVLADRNALRQILGNLLDNALRYTPPGGEVELLAWPGEGERPAQGAANRVTLAVRDTGCGIAPEHWPRLFERFYRVDKSRTRDTGGTGLGLALVKDLVEAHRGRIWLTSKVGKGTIFFITLPTA